jgi:hypothetical protein
MESYSISSQMEEVSISGHNILIIGGNSGVGFEAALQLVTRNANVVITGQVKQSCKVALDKLNEFIVQIGSLSTVNSIVCDFSDFGSINELITRLSLWKFHQVIFNQGLWPTNILSTQGYELSFAANVLAPQYLLRSLIQNKQLHSNARIILTIDKSYNHTKSFNPSADYGTYKSDEQYNNHSSNMLLMLWCFGQFQDHHKEYNCYLVNTGNLDIFGYQCSYKSKIRSITICKIARWAVQRKIQKELKKYTSLVLCCCTGPTCMAQVEDELYLLNSALLMKGGFYNAKTSLSKVHSVENDSHYNIDKALDIYYRVENICKMHE